MLAGLVQLAIRIHVRVKLVPVMEYAYRWVTQIGDVLVRLGFLVAFVIKRVTHLVAPPTRFHIHVRGGK